MKLFEKWWFYLMVVGYLTFGVWYGGVSYRMYQGPDNYGYWSRMVFYPVSNVMKYGWDCKTTSPKRVAEVRTCELQGINSRPFGINTTPYFLKEFSYQEVSYRIMMVLWWPVDAVQNLLAVGVIFVVWISTIYLVVFLSVFPGLLTHLFVWLFSFLL